MKIIANVEKKTLRILENERSIFRGEYGADKLELYINKQLENEYPTITAVLSNGRKIGPYSTDEAYGTETIDGVTYTVANFTLSKANGFTLSEGKMMITIWMNSNDKKEALGNITLNVINTTAFDDGDIIISGDVAGTIVNIKVELENLQSQVNTFNGRITNLEAKKFIDLGTITESPENAENTILNAINKAGIYTFTYDNNTYLMLIREISSTEYRQLIIYEGLSNNIKYILRYPYSDIFRIEKYETANKKYVDEYISSFNNSLYDLEVMIQEHENKVQNIADLGTIEESPTSKNNTILNGVTSGVYTFSYADEQYLMIASMRSLGSKQTILVNNDGVLKYIYRYERTPRTWTVSEKELTTNDYVDKKIADLINGAPETLDTLFEIANALQDDDNAISGLITEISKKANKSDIPTKLSQLEQDVEIGGGGIKVKDLIVEVFQEDGCVSFMLEDTPIDYFKGIRVEIYDNNNLIYTWLFNGVYALVFEDKAVSSKIIATPLGIGSAGMYEFYAEDNEYLGSAEFSCAGNYNYLYFDLILNEYNEMLIDANNLTAKLYYYESNETTPSFSYMY